MTAPPDALSANEARTVCGRSDIPPDAIGVY